MTSNTILMTGASGLIGTELVSAFLGNGDNVAAVCRSSESFDRLCHAIDDRSLTANLTPVIVDLGSDDYLESLKASLVGKNIFPTAFIHNARDVMNLNVSDTGGPTAKQWQKEFNMGVVVPEQIATLLCSIESTMLGSIILVSSIYGTVAVNSALYDEGEQGTPVHYSVVKAAVIHLAKELSIRLAPAGVRVNTISYGGVEGKAPIEFVERYSRFCPQNRMLDLKKDIVGPAVFLCEQGASGVTGHNLVVDGGWSVW